MSTYSNIPLNSQPRRTAIRGVTLIEAMVALLVMSFGMMALVELISSLKRGAEVARQRSEAVRLAQNEVDRLRSFTVLTTTANQFAFSDIASTPNDEPVTLNVTGSNTTYSLTRTVKPINDLNAPGNEIAKDVTVRVAWSDRAGQPQFVQLVSWIARIDPGFSAALSVAPKADFVRSPNDRSAAIPPSAKDLGDGTSAFKPASGGTQAWVMDNKTGYVSKICYVGTDLSNKDLTLAGISECATVKFGYLLAGNISFSYGPVPNAEKPGSDIVFGTKVDENFGTLANPLLTKCVSENDIASKKIRYFCVVPGNTDAPPTWSGSVKLTTLDIGTSPTQFRVCRYTADYDGNKKISNDEHPLNYLKVASPLTNQNFLVIQGSASCPTAPAVNPAAGIFANFSTKEVQPNGDASGEQP